MDTNRALFQVIWPYLRPVSQRKVRMTCSNWHNWGKDWPVTIPDLTELLDRNNWQEWYNETFEPTYDGYINVFACWKWLHKCVSVVVRFYNQGDAILLIDIKVQYEISRHRDFSHTSINPWENTLIRKGKKVKNLPQDQYSAIYKKYRDQLNFWNNQKWRIKLFPYCSCLFRKSAIPGKVTLGCEKIYNRAKTCIRQIYMCKVCAHNNAISN